MIPFSWLPFLLPQALAMVLNADVLNAGRSHLWLVILAGAAVSVGGVCVQWQIPGSLFSGKPPHHSGLSAVRGKCLVIGELRLVPWALPSFPPSHAGVVELG